LTPPLSLALSLSLSLPLPPPPPCLTHALQARGEKKATVEEKRSEFEALVAAVEQEVALKAAAAATTAAASAAAATTTTTAAEVGSVGNKCVETSAFTICVRIRPVLPADSDLSDGTNNFKVTRGRF
jgi:hypothetical protein